MGLPLGGRDTRSSMRMHVIEGGQRRRLFELYCMEREERSYPFFSSCETAQLSRTSEMNPMMRRIRRVSEPMRTPTKGVDRCGTRGVFAMKHHDEQIEQARLLRLTNTRCVVVCPSHSSLHACLRIDSSRSQVRGFVSEEAVHTSCFRRCHDSARVGRLATVYSTGHDSICLLNSGTRGKS